MHAAADPTTPSRRGRPGHDRAAVVRAATELFDRHGYDHTSVGDVARELGVTKSAIYHHVRGKEHLLELAVSGALDALEAALDEIAAAPLGAEERLREAVRRSVLILVDHLAAVRLLLAVRGNTAGEQHVLDRRREMDQRLAAMAREAAGEGSLRSDVEPLLVSRLLFGMVNSLTEWVRPGHDAAQLAETVAALAFEGLRRRSRP
ncbi:MAG: TetR family transcriptional regulator [Nocardioides sp.]|nr:TetR family transcriptional regulator [Nocardioides sp.]